MKTPIPHVAIHMTTADTMLGTLSRQQLREAIFSVGGRANYTVKLSGKSCKAYIIPQSAINAEVLDHVKDRKMCFMHFY